VVGEGADPILVEADAGTGTVDCGFGVHCSLAARPALCLRGAPASSVFIVNPFGVLSVRICLVFRMNLVDGYGKEKVDSGLLAISLFHSVAF
jgi:hypothetical protein